MNHSFRFVTRRFAGLSTAVALVFTAGVAFAAEPSTKPSTKPTAPATAPATKPSTRPVYPVPPAPKANPNAPKLPDLSATPKTAADLKAIEQRVEQITTQVMPSVVGIQANGGQGSGVIITKDGYVLTAGHVSGDPGTEVTVILTDGRRAKGKSLGLNKGIDSGLIKIDDEGEYPVAEIGKSADLKQGQWVIALGHPGGYRRDRPPVLRLGRVLVNGGSNGFLMTDCTLIGGDSGGPLFDLSGRIVGIHSRIGPSTLNNMHTPSDTYLQTWDRLARGDSWGDRAGFTGGRGPVLGITGETVDGKGAKINKVDAGGPAEKAGLKVDDLVTEFDGKPIRSMEDLAEAIGSKRSNQQVTLGVDRGGKTVELKATLGRRPRGG